MPAAGKVGLADHRVMIREYEIFQTDSEFGEDLSIDNPKDVPIRRRMVYADTFPLVPGGGQ